VASDEPSLPLLPAALARDVRRFSADVKVKNRQGLVTSAQKLNRKGLLEKYKKEIDEAYKSSS